MEPLISVALVDIWINRFRALFNIQIKIRQNDDFNGNCFRHIFFVGIFNGCQFAKKIKWKSGISFPFEWFSVNLSDMRKRVSGFVELWTDTKGIDGVMFWTQIGHKNARPRIPHWEKNDRKNCFGHFLCFERLLQKSEKKLFEVAKFHFTYDIVFSRICLVL